MHELGTDNTFARPAGGAVAAMPRQLADRLDREWRRLSFDRRAVERADGWAVVTHRVGDLDSLLACAGYRPTGGADVERPCGSCADGDPVLRRLVALAAADDLAGRVVLQRVLPGLRHRARQWSGGPAQLDVDDTLGELLAAAWPLIRAYDIRRPGMVAVNLVRDSAYSAFVVPRRRMSRGERPTDPDTFCRRPEELATSPCTELASLLVEAHDAGIDGGDLALLRDLTTKEGAAEQLARRHHVTTRAIRYRRTRALRRLRSYALG